MVQTTLKSDSSFFWTNTPTDNIYKILKNQLSKGIEGNQKHFETSEESNFEIRKLPSVCFCLRTLYGLYNMRHLDVKQKASGFLAQGVRKWASTAAEK